MGRVRPRGGSARQEYAEDAKELLAIWINRARQTGISARRTDEEVLKAYLAAIRANREHYPPAEKRPGRKKKITN
jgi:hypothetical protein